MIIRRELLQALQPILEDDPTHRCDKIEVRPTGEVAATDGHILLVAREPHRFPDEDYPAVTGVPADTHDPAEAVTIPADLVDGILKALPKKSTIPILGGTRLAQNGEAGAYLTATDLQAATVLKVPAQTDQVGGFPNWERVMPAKDRPAITVSLSADILEQLVKAARAVRRRARKYSKEIGPMVTLQIPTETKHQGRKKADHNFRPVGTGIERHCECGRKHVGAQYRYLDEPDGVLIDSIRLEIPGDDVTIEGVLMPVRVNPQD